MNSGRQGRQVSQSKLLRAGPDTGYEQTEKSQDATRAAMKVVEASIGERLSSKKEVIHYDSPHKEQARKAEQAILSDHHRSKV